MVYYLPYLRKYFIAIEKAYENVARFAAKSFVGFIVVVDNTHRGVVIPVGAIVVEIWKELGFQATIHSSKEVFHVGAKNPRAKGIRAKHQEIVVWVWR